MKRSRRNRKALLATLLTGSIVLTTTGCANPVGTKLASINPFSKSKPTTPTQAKPGVTESIANSTKTMWNRSGEAVTGIFNKEKGAVKEELTSNVDPLRLDRKAVVTAEVLVANGRLWESTGNLQKAMENYTKALETEPSYPDALTNIARLHYRQGNHQQAADFFGRAIKQKPNDAGLYNDLGLTLSKLNNHAAADQTLTKALQLAPGTSRYANNLASVKFESGNKPGAYEVLAKNNKPAIAHFNMAYLYYKHGEMGDAQKHLSEVIKFEPAAGTDSSIKLAIDRSRQMLAQITTPTGNIASLSTGLPNGATQNGIVQTSQSATINEKAVISPAAVPGATMPAKSVAPSFSIEQVSTAKDADAKIASKPEPSKVMTPATEASKPAATLNAKPPANDTFALPPSFQMPTE